MPYKHVGHVRAQAPSTQTPHPPTHLVCHALLLALCVVVVALPLLFGLNVSNSGKGAAAATVAATATCECEGAGHNTDSVFDTSRRNLELPRQTPSSAVTDCCTWGVVHAHASRLLILAIAA